MAQYSAEEKVQISHKSEIVLNQILDDNPILKEILLNSENEVEVNKSIKKWALSELRKNELAYKYYIKEAKGRKTTPKITNKTYGKK